MKKRITSILLAVILAISALTVATPVSAATTFKSSLSDGTAVDREIEKRIGELIDVLDGGYFTTDQKPCKSYRESTHSCGKCLASSICGEPWFQAAVAQLSWLDNNDASSVAAKIPYTVFGGSLYGDGHSCHGFATTALSLIFFDTAPGQLTTQTIGTFRNNYETLKNVIKIGDIIRTSNGHSYLVTDISSSGIKTIDSNWTAPLNCLVQVHTMPYSYGYYVTVDRCSTRSNIHTCRFDANTGACVCGAKNYKLTYNTATTTYTRKWWASDSSIYSAPYSASATVARTGKTLTVIGTAVNKFGNTWYIVRYNTSNSCELGFIYSGTVTNYFDKTSSTVAKPTITSGSITRTTSSTARLTWSYSGSIKQFTVEYSADGKTWYTDRDYQSPLSSTYITRDLCRDLQFRIRAHSANGTSSDYYYISYTHNPVTTSTPSSSTTQGTGTATITSASAKRIGKTSTATISWSAKNATSYEVYYSRDQVTWYIDPDFTNKSQNSYTTTDLVRSLYFKVVPYNAANEAGTPIVFYYQH